MFGRRITLFRLLGFSVRVDMSWVFIAVLIAWSLAAGYFPSLYKGLSRGAYWWMGIVGALGLFASVVFHELCHSLVARRYGLAIKGITLFIFGGVAEMDQEPSSPKVEFLMAAAGPLSSAAVGVASYGVYLAGRAAGWPLPVVAVIHYLGGINGLLVAFNLLPGFPLDGGRVFRSILWYWKDNLRWATRVASRVGAGFGLGLIVLGVLHILTDNFMAGLWWFLIGLFLRHAAASSYQQLLMRQTLEGERVSRFMTTDVVTVPPSISMEELVENYVYRHHYKMFPVVDGGRLVGYVTLRQIKEVPRPDWPRRTAGELAKPCSPECTIRPDDDAIRALSIMSRTRFSRLLVTEGDRLVGIITLKDMLHFLSLKIELEEGKA